MHQIRFLVSDRLPVCPFLRGQSDACLSVHMDLDTASIIQESGMDPVAYILNASDLHPIHQHNMIFK